MLMREGRTESEAVRVALQEASERRLSRSALEAEAMRLAADEVDRREVRAVLADMDAISADWPGD